MQEANALVGLHECLGLYDPSLLMLLCAEVGHNTLYNAPLYFGKYERSRHCRFSRIVGNTHSKSPFILKVKQISHDCFLPDRGPEHANTLTLY